MLPMTTDPYRRHGFSIGRTNYLFRKRIIEELQRVNSPLNPEEAWLLIIVDEAGGMAQTGAIRDVMMRDPSTLTRQLDHACEKGLLRRKRDGTDGRVINIILTSQGRSELARVMPGFKALRKVAIAGISTEDLRVMTSALLKIQENLQSSNKLSL